MYLHLGNEYLVKNEDIIGIFDLDSTTISKRTRDYLKVSERKKQVTVTSYELPKAFVVCAKKRGENNVFISQLSSATLLSRFNTSF